MTAPAGARGLASPRPNLPIGAYLAHVVAGAKLERAIPAVLAGRAAFLFVTLFIFSRIWDLVQAAGGLGERTEAELIWYIAITEWVVLSTPQAHLEIEEDLRSGTLVARLPQPVSYFGARFAESLGAAAVRMGVLGFSGLLSALVLAGRPPDEPASLLVAAPLALVATVLSVAWINAIGGLAIWLHDTSPLYWVWQKLVYILGGLLLPLEIYPDRLREVAEWTPFAAMLNGPGRMVFGVEGADALSVGLLLLAWLAFAGLLLRTLWARASRSLEAFGG